MLKSSQFTSLKSLIISSQFINKTQLHIYLPLKTNSLHRNKSTPHQTYFTASTFDKSSVIIHLIATLTTSKLMNTGFRQVKTTQSVDVCPPFMMQRSQAVICVEKPSCEKPSNGSQIVVKPSYRWSQDQHRRYMSFLAQNIDIFKLSYLQKMKLKIHVKMSNHIQKRNSYQCRSHHQKMLAKYGSVENVIREFSRLLAVQSTIREDPREGKSILQGKQKQPKEVSMQSEVCESDQISQLNDQGKKLIEEVDLVLIEEDEVTYKTFF